MSNETFADRLRKAMGDRGIKQVDLVRAAAGQGVKLGKSHVSQYVSGKTVPRTDILHFLAAALQVDEDWLLNGNIKKPEKINERENKSPGGRIMYYMTSEVLSWRKRTGWRAPELTS